MARRKKKKSNQTLALVVTVLAAVAFVVIFGVIVSSCAHGSSVGETEPPVTEEPRETAPLNAYAPEDFYLENGFLRYGTDSLVGIDVSTHQGLIDWQAVKDAGVEFAIIRAGYRGTTQGLLYEDELFRANLDGAKEAGLLVGVYFFSQAANEEEAAEEAEFVCGLLDGAKLDLPIYYDWEEVSGQSRIPGVAEIPMTECAVAFCEAIKAQGYEAGVYFNQTYGYDHLDLLALQDYSLWLAEYGNTPTFDYHFHCLQYTDSGVVDGIETEVDLNVFFR
ncbi:MAG: glycoside hydrolase family 25 protein [Faecousia sp.]